MLFNKRNALLLSSLVIFFTSCTIIFFASCAKIEYTNPLDPKCDNYVGPDSAADDDGDGIANIYDSDSDYRRVDDDLPVIELLGKNPDTLRFKQSDSTKFYERLNQLAKDFNCYDSSDKSVGNDDVEVNVTSIAFIEGSQQYLKYSVKDSSGNYTSVNRIIVVIFLPEDDVTPPSISPNIFFVTNDTVEISLGAQINYINYIYISDEDNSDFAIGKNVTLEGEAKTDKVGVYKVKYTAVDSSGNKSSYTLYFKVTDDGGSVTDARIDVYYKGVLLLDNSIIEDTLPDVSFNPSLLTSEAYEFVNNEKVDLNAEFDCDYEAGKAGLFTATFSVVGRNGVEIRREVKIAIHETSEDPECDTAITLELKGAPVCTVEVGKTFEDPGFTATRTKPSKKDVTSQVEVSPENINTNNAGEITITYEISACGKPIIKTRTLRIIKSNTKDTNPPEITLKHSKAQDTVTVGTRYSRDYKSIDTGNKAVDDVDGEISWSKVKIDTSGFKTSEAGKPCSLVYKVKDAAGNEGKAVRKITVIAGASESLLDKYGVPSSSKLAPMNVEFTKITVEGTGGPSKTSIIQKFNINLGQNGILNVFSINTEWSQDNPTTYYDLKSKGTFKFDQSNPEMKLTDTGLDGFDNEYYVVYKDDQFIWVEKSGKFAIIWEQ